MCGIFCEVIYSDKKNNVKNDKNILQRIDNRGPDSVQELHLKYNEIHIIFRGSVLWMQGPVLTPQPVKNDDGILLYNGDIFDETWEKNISDTQIIMKKLSKDTNDRKQHILQVLKSLKGPFSLIYYDIATHNMYCLRDKIGRSSLLFHKNEDSFILSSVLGRGYKCVELPATFIHIINLDTLNIELHSWNSSSVQESDLITWFNNLTIQQNLPDEDYEFEFERNYNLSEEDISLVHYIDSVVKEKQCKLTIMKDILKHDTINHTVLQLTKLLEKSLKARLETQPMKCKNCLNTRSECNHCTVGILFSGGLDCTILAFLTDKFVPKAQPIDLINVAFKKNETSSYDVPDRITGKQSLEELKKLCYARKWVFREINVPKDEVDEMQRNTIADLVFPRQTILDESLGTALWFAARSKDKNDVSSCRILLLGSGADELFGGYSRHRNAFKYHGWTGLNKELMLDWKRISFRNLARDNRVICDHGRQPRMPYLDEEFANFVLNLKPCLRCYPSENLGPGIGDKLMLRLIAFNFGLSGVSTFPKRALQFGSRIANKKEKGSDLSKNF